MRGSCVRLRRLELLDPQANLAGEDQLALQLDGGLLLTDTGRDRHRRLTLTIPAATASITTIPASTTSTVSSGLAREGSAGVDSIPSAGITAITTTTAGSRTAGEQHEDSNEERGRRASHGGKYVQYRHKGQ